MPDFTTDRIQGLRLNYNAKTSNYTATLSDDYIPVDATSGNVTITLPTAVGISGKVYVIQKTDSSTNTVIIDPAGSETINGATTLTLSYQNEQAEIYSNDTNWLKIGVYVNPTIKMNVTTDWIYGSPTPYFLRWQADGVLNFGNVNGIWGMLIDPNSSGLRLWDSDYSNQYRITSGNLTGTYDIQLPVITANDVLASNDSITTFTNKNLNGIKWGVVTKSADATLADNELIISVSASGANRTMTLPAASGRTGKIYIIQKSDSSTNTVTIDPNASETVNGSTTFVLTAQYQAVTIWCDGSNWFTQPNSSERTGKAIASGNGSTTTFNIAHGIGATPSNVFVDCSSHAIARTYTVDSTNISITFTSAPSSGTNNVIIYWRAVA